MKNRNIRISNEGLLIKPCSSCNKPYVVGSFFEWRCDEEECPYSVTEVIDVSILTKMIEGKRRVILKGTPKDDWAVKWNDCIDEILEDINKYKERK